MTIKFNDFNNGYNNYNFVIGKATSKESKKAEETKEIEKSNVEFKGLKNETDLLTKNVQNLYGVNVGKFAPEDKDLADSTNEILASLGYSYKVSAAQVASVTNSVKTVVMPGMKTAEDGAVAAHIQDPNGPFAELFA
ncbi:hypothetical protein HDR58_02535 [bacterium]|nr:hypothetical protein [bacterium]